jgi:hypothetical protein
MRTTKYPEVKIKRSLKDAENELYWELDELTAKYYRVLAAMRALDMKVPHRHRGPRGRGNRPARSRDGQKPARRARTRK